MKGIVRCPTCGADLIEEEFVVHKCNLGKPTIRRIVDVTYQWWLKAKNDPFIAIMGEDGTLYRFSPAPNTLKYHPDDERNLVSQSKSYIRNGDRLSELRWSTFTLLSFFTRWGSPSTKRT